MDGRKPHYPKFGKPTVPKAKATKFTVPHLEKPSGKITVPRKF